MKARMTPSLSQYEGKTEGISVNKSSPGDNEQYRRSQQSYNNIKAVTAASMPPFGRLQVVKGQMA